MTKNRISGLDGLRALSISLVIFAHVAHTFPVASYGGFGVSVFFVLSGFLITWLMCAEEDRYGQVSLGSFYLRRALRILPAAFLFLAAVQILGWLGLAEVAPYDVFYCLTFVRNIWGSGVHTGHFWSLSVEEQFYLGWPLLFILLRTNRARLALAIVSLLALPFWQHAVFVMHHGAQFVNSERFDMRCEFILTGSSLALANHDPRLRTILKAMRTVTIGVACTVLCAWAISPFFPVRAFAGVSAAIAVALVVNSVIDRAGGFLNWTPVVWAGNLSYSVYLWQQIFCFRSRLGWLGMFPLNILASLACACASYYFIERPLAKVRSRVPHFLNPGILLKLNSRVHRPERQDAAPEEKVGPS
jgi:peptidoglycan/LPS O-acetylase OafA/YrhL